MKSSDSKLTHYHDDCLEHVGARERLKSGVSQSPSDKVSDAEFKVGERTAQVVRSTTDGTKTGRN